MLGSHAGTEDASDAVYGVLWDTYLRNEREEAIGARQEEVSGGLDDTVVERKGALNVNASPVQDDTALVHFELVNPELPYLVSPQDAKRERDQAKSRSDSRRQGAAGTT